MTREEYYDWGLPNPLNSPELNKTEGGQTNNIDLHSRDCFEDKFLGKQPTDKIMVFVIYEQDMPSTPWRSEDRRVGKECVTPCRSLCSPYNPTKNILENS